MPTFRFVTAPLLASAVMFMTMLSIPSASGTTLNGTVQSRGTCSIQPLVHVPVRLFEATTGQPTMLGQATTHATGRFSIQSPKNVSSSTFYVSADIGEGVEFLTIFGARLPATVTMNELTTVAASYSMAQFFKRDVIPGNSFGLQIAAGMNDNIVTPMTGESSLVLLSSPNADQSNSVRSTRSIGSRILTSTSAATPVAMARSFLLVSPPRPCHKNSPATQRQNTRLLNVSLSSGEPMRYSFYAGLVRPRHSPARA